MVKVAEMGYNCWRQELDHDEAVYEVLDAIGC